MSSKLNINRKSIQGNVRRTYKRVKSRLGIGTLVWEEKKDLLFYQIFFQETTQTIAIE